MCYYLLILLFFSTTALAQTVPVAQAERTEALLNNASQTQSLTIEQGTLIREISIEGFVLQDKDQFVNLFKPFRNKRLSPSDINGLLDQLKVIYELAGYQNLVSITYLIKKKHLIFTVTMIS